MMNDALPEDIRETMSIALENACRAAHVERHRDRKRIAEAILAAYERGEMNFDAAAARALDAAGYKQAG